MRVKYIIRLILSLLSMDMWFGTLNQSWPSSAVGHCWEVSYHSCADLWPSCFLGSLEFHAVNKTITTAVAYYFPAQGKLSLQWLTSRGYSLGWISETFITEFFLKPSKYSHIISAVRSDSETANISIFNIRLRRLYRLISQRRRSNAEVKWRVKSIVLSVMNVILLQ